MDHRIIHTVIMGICLFTFIGIAGAARPEYVPGELIIRLAPEVTLMKSGSGIVTKDFPGIDALNEKFEVMEYRRIFRSETLKDVYVWTLRTDAEMRDIADQYEKQTGVVYASPDYYAGFGSAYESRDTLPDDTYFDDQWGLHNTGQAGGTVDADIDAPEAWDITTGSSSVIIAILDTGIDLDHPDLAGNLMTGYDIFNDDDDPQDDNGHGTHVAGIAGAIGNNFEGISGACWNCTLMPVKVLGVDGYGPYSQIVLGIEYAANNGADVINLSLGSETFSPSLQDAVNYAHGLGCVVVGASGNFNREDPFYPAACDNVLGVAALDRNDMKYTLSGYGDWVDLAAPGVSIMSTVWNDTYASWSGTSMAAPFVSGVAGLLFSANPGWTNSLVEAQMIRLADDVDGVNPGYAGKLGSGRVNAYNGLTTTPLPELSVSAVDVNDPAPGDEDGVLDPDETVDIIVTLHNTWGAVTGVTGTLSTSDPEITINDDTGTFGDIGSQQSIDNTSDPFNVTLDTDCPAGHVISFDLDVQDSRAVWNLMFELVTGSREYTVPTIISTDTTWIENETYLVTGNVLVWQNAILTIQPG